MPIMRTAPDVLYLDEAIEPSLAGTKASTLARLRQAGERIPDGFVITVAAAATLDPTTLGSQLKTALSPFAGGRMAVRSSAIAEDLEDASHAGEYETVLDVAADAAAVLDAAGKVVGSAHGAPIAVLVQTMIDPTTAGAAFSANPVTGDREVVVSAVAGLADKLMDGSVLGDEWAVRDERAVHLSGSATDEALVLEVATMARRLESHSGNPVDIEWAHDGSALHLLQCRPITALPIQPDLKIPEGSWQKDSTHHPGPLSPLVASYQYLETDGLSRWAKRSGLILDAVKQVTVGGELYIQPVPVGGGSGKPPPRLIMGLIARLHPELRARMATAKRLVESGILENAARRWREEWKPETMAAAARLRAIDVGALDDDELMAHLADVLTFTNWASDVHFDLIIPYVVAIHEFVTGCARMLGWDEHAALRLLTGHSPASSEPTTAMRKVADTIRRSPAAMAALQESDGDVVQHVSAADRPSAQAIEEWISTYGFRTTQYEWSSLTIGEQPGLIGRMIKAAVDGETKDLDDGGLETSARQNLSSADAAEFDRLLSRARDVYPTREDSIHWSASVSGALLRRTYLEIGTRLAVAGTIAGADDVFMLERDELAKAFSGRGRSLQDLVRRRRAERAWVMAHPGPATLGDPSGPPPDISAFPDAGRRINQALLWMVGAEFTPITASATAGNAIRGIPGAAGTYTGTARIVRSEVDFARVQVGDVVICPVTNPSWSVLFGIAGAFVCDAGGPLSHTAVLTREYAIPSVLATGDATSRIVDGALVTVDGAAGTVVPATMD
jgi:rifampicin phosphotransferase